MRRFLANKAALTSLAVFILILAGFLVWFFIFKSHSAESGRNQLDSSLQRRIQMLEEKARAGNFTAQDLNEEIYILRQISKIKH